MNRIRIGVLGLQGAVREHLKTFQRCGVDAIAVKSADGLDLVNGLVIPGGESTTIRRLLDTSGMVAPLIKFSQARRPIFGTCAGLILLAKKLISGETHNLGLMNITVERNSFGRQVDSFETDLEIQGLDKPFPAVFIRAPHIVEVGEGVDVLSSCQNRMVMVRQGHLLGCSFHPELTDDDRISRLFIDMVAESFKD